ncbi:aminodeoxychorismate lyase [Simiduia sp. 21SJ11W-1]|uniref:aminodeoxychorismate lyase n=1 Tax=Simiduia sp. 21SJ11W-1 TaxID=2909669 RepID=UPI00209C7BD8|nr:aminodeoxychorismate lyase [Simiduia sp. 21SJ11W-1]UTA46341.1 aminodeoxychorismate lyase [Simiduia sp. 21SJ11W-1]
MASASVITLIDGVAGAACSAQDRGLLYGQGLFETARVMGGEVPLLSWHLKRLLADAPKLFIAPPDAGQISRQIKRVLSLAAAEGQRQGRLKILLTPGAGGLGYQPEPDAKAQVIIQFFPASAQKASEISACISPVRLADSPLAGIKHCNRLEQVLAARALAISGFDEAVMCDSRGQLVEGVSSNLVLGLGGKLVTPSLSQAGVKGVMRACLLAKGVIEQAARPLTLEDLADADALYFINAYRGVQATWRLDMAGATCSNNEALGKVKTFNASAGRQQFLAAVESVFSERH